MNDRSPAAFFTSLALHGLVVAALLLGTYVANSDTKAKTEIFEMVAGEGDNFAATEAPALGTEGGIKLTMPQPAAPVPITAPEPEPVNLPTPTVVAPTPPPVAKPAPAPKTVVPNPDAKKAPPTERTMAQQFTRTVIVADSKVKMQLERDRKAAEKKRQEKEKADRLERAKEAKLAAANAPRVDAVGIAKGVLGGSTANKEGGAGGKALTRADGPVLEAYFALLRERLLKALDKPPGLSDTLVTEAEFRIGADGTISGVKITSPSGSVEFDRAVVEAYARVRMPLRPDGKSSVHLLKFRTKDLDGG